MTTQPNLYRRGANVALHALVVAALATSVVGIAAGSASADDNMDTTANVAVTSGITLTALTSSFTLTGAPGATVDTATPVTYNVETNNPTGYSVTVQSATAAMVPVGTSNTDTIPIADLTVRETGTTAYTAVSAATAVEVHAQAGRSANGGDVLSTDFQMRIPTVAADTYTATLNYLATAAL